MFGTRFVLIRSGWTVAGRVFARADLANRVFGGDAIGFAA
jgi:hypothetical protein